MKAAWIGFPREGEDFWVSVEAYAKLGYRGMEGGEALLSNGNFEENLARFTSLGLEVLTVSTSVDDVVKDVDAVIARAKRVNTNRATIWWSPAMTGNADGFDKLVAEVAAMEQAATAMAKENIRLCFHNHQTEFFPQYGQPNTLDYMMQNSEKLWLELDVAWANFGGANPVDVLRTYKNRLAAVHIKDYLPNPDSADTPIFTSLGTGVMDLLAVLQYLHDINFPWVVYEQDNMRNLSTMESVTLSYLYMKESGLVE